MSISNIIDTNKRSAHKLQRDSGYSTEERPLGRALDFDLSTNFQDDIGFQVEL